MACTGFIVSDLVLAHLSLNLSLSVNLRIVYNYSGDMASYIPLPEVFGSIVGHISNLGCISALRGELSLETHQVCS